MKKFTQKFFLLSMGLMLSMGASAQSSDGIAHRYPEFTFTATVSVKGTNETFTFTMPAWDAVVSSEIPEGTGMGYRLQLIENPTSTSGTWRARIVGSRAFSHEKSTVTGDYWFASFANSTDIVITKPDGTTLEAKTGTVTYKDIFGIYDAETNPNGVADGDKNTNPFTVSKTTSTTDNLVIEKERFIQGGKWKNYTFKIVEIGEAAFRNTNPTNTLSSLSVTGTITIPNTIEKIGHNAFRHGAFKKVVFEEGSQVTTIERATFEGNKNLEEVHFPASVTTIKGTALGSCEKLNKVVFEGSTVPTFILEEEEPLYKVGNKTMPEDGYNIFQGAFRLQTGYDGTTGKDVTPAKCVIQVPLEKAKSYIESDAMFTQFPFSSPFPLTTTSGLMTYCSELDYTFKKYDTSSQNWGDADMKAYYVMGDNVEIENGKVMLTPVPDDAMIAGWDEDNDFGVVLKGTSGETYEIFYPNGVGTGINQTLSMENIDNCLKGCVTATNVAAGTDENHSYFIMSGGVFKRIMKNGQCKANRAYIKISGGPDIDMGTTDESRELVLAFPGETTGITAHEVQGTQNDAWYTLQGIQVLQPSKGIFIKNGKKVVIK